jgi:hypothetical protein
MKKPEERQQRTKQQSKGRRCPMRFLCSISCACFGHRAADMMAVRRTYTSLTRRIAFQQLIIAFTLARVELGEYPTSFGKLNERLTIDAVK